MEEITGLQVVRNCGNKNRTIYIIPNTELIQIGCTAYKLEGAIEAIREKYGNKESDEYIAKVKQCYEAGITAFNTLINDESGDVRMSVAKFGNDQHRDILINDKVFDVRMSVAKFGNDQHRDLLIKDKYDYVRFSVARFGNDQHRDFLINDKAVDVRYAVAKFGNDQHRDRLVNDKDYYVRYAVAQYGNGQQS